MDYKVTSFSEGRNGAQITVTVGEGRSRRSFTRHLQRRGGAWIGLNIDERAVPLNKLYEAELRKAEIDLADAETWVKDLQKRLEVVGDVDPSKVDEINIEAARAMLDGMIETAELDVYAAAFILDDAETKLAIVQRELPLMMEFRRN